MSQDKPSRSNTSSKWLIIIGVAWLILAGALLYFQLAAPATVTIQWDTETELDTAGFYLYRSEINEDNFVQVNDSLINSEGSAVSGASYSFEDRNVEAGKTYVYLLEEIQNDGTANRYEDDKFSYAVPAAAWWAIILAAVFILVGIGLLVLGFKETRQ